MIVMNNESLSISDATAESFSDILLKMERTNENVVVPHFAKDRNQYFDSSEIPNDTVISGRRIERENDREKTGCSLNSEAYFEKYLCEKKFIARR